VRPVTLVFYAAATLCLGSIAWVEGGPRMIAETIHRPDLTLAIQSAWGWATMLLALTFLLMGIFLATTQDRTPD
jgi:hypothetical protein